MRKHTFWYGCSIKAQIGLGFCTVWSEALLSAWKLCIIGYPECIQWRFCSDCWNAQAYLNLCLVHMSRGMFSDVRVHIFIAPPWKSGAILDLPCPSLILWFCHYVIPSFRDTLIPWFRDCEIKMHFDKYFYVCGLTSMKFILHLVSKVVAEYWPRAP